MLNAVAFNIHACKMVGSQRLVDGGIAADGEERCVTFKIVR
jgi:hypothetical protein